jgi:hypothetical protein
MKTSKGPGAAAVTAGLKDASTMATTAVPATCGLMAFEDRARTREVPVKPRPDCTEGHHRQGSGGARAVRRSVGGRAPACGGEQPDGGAPTRELSHVVAGGVGWGCRRDEAPKDRRLSWSCLRRRFPPPLAGLCAARPTRDGPPRCGAPRNRPGATFVNPTCSRGTSTAMSSLVPLSSLRSRS